jgi:hypothetical protein
MKPIVYAGDPQWAKSSHSGGGNDCVEVQKGLVRIRDTKNRNGGVLSVSADTGAAFLAAIRDGSITSTNVAA